MALQLNQELQNKYPHLEVSVLKYSDAMKDNDSKRIDSEFFKKEYLENLRILKKHNTEILGNLVKKITGGATPLGANYPENGVPFLRVQNIMQNYFNLSDIVYISQKDDEDIKRSRLKLNDVLLTITGVSYGKSAVVDKHLVGANINQHSVKIEVKSINPYFLSTFLNSKVGYSQSSKSVVGITRPALDYQAIKKFIVPIFSNEFQQQIEQMVCESHACLEQSKGLYREAEVLLYRELGLDPENPLASIEPHSGSLNISVRPLSQSLNATGRLDSEYYQQKYDEIEKVIKNYRGGYMKLKDIGEFKNGSLISEDFYVEKAKRAYIRIKELSFNEPIKIAESVFIDDNFEAKNETTVKEHDFVIATIGSVGKVNLIPKELNGSFISNNTSKFSLLDNDILPEFLELLLRSILVQEQILKEITQTVQPKISNYSLENIVIPKINLQTQTQIAEKIKQSFTLRKKASELLQTAKQSVENAIEKG